MPRKKNPLTPDELVQIETMAGMGLTIAQMAAILGMSKATLDRRLAEHKGGSEALEKGRAISLLNVAQTAYTMAKSGKVPAMTMFYLKCRGGWKETQVLEHSGKDGDAIEVKSRPLTTLEATQLLQTTLKKDPFYAEGNDAGQRDSQTPGGTESPEGDL